MTSEVAQKVTDLKIMGSTMAAQLNGTAGGRWEKFYSDTGTDPVPLVKITDINVFSRTAIAAHFDKSIAAEGYLNQLTPSAARSGGLAKAIKSKRESDFLASLHQALALRYTSHIRSQCAALSRRGSIGLKDMEVFGITYIDKWTG